MNNNIIAIISKVPLPGLSKTRLSPPFSLKQCAALSFSFLKDILNTVSSINDVDVIVFFSPKIKKEFFQRLLKGVKIESEQGKTLGEKLVFIFNALSVNGYENIVIVPADCPDMPQEYFERAFKVILQGQHSVVIGPSSDGAFNLIGIKSCNSETINAYLRDIDWNPDFSLKKLIQQLEKAHISVYQLPISHDIDTFSDITAYLRRSGGKKTYTRLLIDLFISEKP